MKAQWRAHSGMEQRHDGHNTHLSKARTISVISAASSCPCAKPIWYGVPNTCRTGSVTPEALLAWNSLALTPDFTSTGVPLLG